MLASTKMRAPLGRSSSFIQLFFQHSTNESRIGAHYAECLLGDTRLCSIRITFLFAWRHGDFHLSPVWHWQRLFQDDHIPFDVSCIFHSCVSSGILDTEAVRSSRGPRF